MDEWNEVRIHRVAFLAFNQGDMKFEEFVWFYESIDEERFDGFMIWKRMSLKIQCSRIITKLILCLFLSFFLLFFDLSRFYFCTHSSRSHRVPKIRSKIRVCLP